MGLLKKVGKALKKVASIALPLAGAAVGGKLGGTAGAAVGGMLGLSYASTQKANDIQKQQYENTMDYNIQMSNSAHQREVDDMRLAGLNPILSVTGGSGASVPALSAGGLHTFSDDGQALVNARQQNLALKAQVENMNADTALKTANAVATTEMLPYQKALSIAQQDATNAQALNVNADTANKQVENMNAYLDYRLNSALKGAQADFYETPVGQAAIGYQTLLKTAMPQLPIVPMLNIGSSAKSAGAKAEKIAPFYRDGNIYFTE